MLFSKQIIVVIYHSPSPLQNLHPQYIMIAYPHKYQLREPNNRTVSNEPLSISLLVEARDTDKLIKKMVSRKVQGVTQQIYIHFEIYAPLVATSKTWEDKAYVYEKKENE